MPHINCIRSCREILHTLLFGSIKRIFIISIIWWDKRNRLNIQSLLNHIFCLDYFLFCILLSQPFKFIITMVQSMNSKFYSRVVSYTYKIIHKYRILIQSDCSTAGDWHNCKTLWNTHISQQFRYIYRIPTRPPCSNIIASDNDFTHISTILRA